jgi:hypothetical protein
MKLVSIAGLGALGLLYAGPAQALTIVNVDPDPHTITVTVGSDSKELTIAPEKEVDAPCGDGCKVKLDNGEEYELKGGEAVSIEDGVIFVDSSPDANIEDAPDIDPDAPGAGEGAQGGDGAPESPAPDDSASAKPVPPPQ